jgi:hypothetical protein
VLIGLTTQEAHGYELASTVERLTGACPDNAAVYRALRSLEEADAVESCWVPAASGPARREYRIAERAACCSENGRTNSPRGPRYAARWPRLRSTQPNDAP